MTVAGLIFSNIHDSSVPELTSKRTMASVPFGGRYRLIDFALSNMVNADITKIGVVTHYNYQSLLDHIGTGKDWDLARRSGGIKILPPFITAYENTASSRLYTSRLEALMGVTNFISRCNEEYIVMSDCDTVCNVDIADVIRTHESSCADITVVVKNVDPSEYMLNSSNVKIISDANSRITDVEEYVNCEGSSDLSMNIFVLKREYLQNIIQESMARGYKSLYRDVIKANASHNNYKIYRYEGPFALINSLESYFRSSMKLLGTDVREELLSVKNRPIHTKVRNSAPTRYVDNPSVKNSIIADGCIIEGTVENSILFRGVKVGKGSVIKNSVLLQDTFTGENVFLNCVITDKNVMIKDGRILSGHESMPFYIAKGMMI